jgi:hypothetical protein
VRALKDAGDADGSRALAKRRKPTRAAHALNLLAHDQPEDVAAYLDRAADMRAAQIAAARDDAARDTLRARDRERRERLAALLARVGEDRDDVERALASALVDNDIATAVRAGTLERIPETPTGFDAFASDLGDVPAPARRAATDRRRRDELRRLDDEIHAAQADAKSSDAAVQSARDALHAAERRATEATRRLDRLREQRGDFDD